MEGPTPTLSIKILLIVSEHVYYFRKYPKQLKENNFMKKYCTIGYF